MTRRREPEFLYHVTTYRRLREIAERGLERGRARAIGASAYDDHARRGIFLTSAEGVFFWHSRAEDHAEHGSDDLLEDGVVPVVLRIDERGIPDDRLEGDPIGTHDARADAWIAEGPIDPEYIEVFDGDDWIPIHEWRRIDPHLGVVEEEDPDGEEGEVLYFFPDRSPLLPEELWP